MTRRVQIAFLVWLSFVVIGGAWAGLPAADGVLPPYGAQAAYGTRLSLQPHVTDPPSCPDIPYLSDGVPGLHPVDQNPSTATRALVKSSAFRRQQHIGSAVLHQPSTPNFTTFIQSVNSQPEFTARIHRPNSPPKFTAHLTGTMPRRKPKCRPDRMSRPIDQYLPGFAPPFPKHP